MKGVPSEDPSVWCFGTLSDMISFGRHVPGLAFLTFTLTPAECRAGSMALFMVAPGRNGDLEKVPHLAGSRSELEPRALGSKTHYLPPNKPFDGTLRAPNSCPAPATWDSSPRLHKFLGLWLLQREEAEGLATGSP